jgi:hypothetical protein
MKQVGYAWLKEHFPIEAIDYWVTSYVQEKGTQRTEIHDGHRTEFLRASAWPGDHWTKHLEFALKREGLHLEFLRKLMPLLPRQELIDYIQATPTGRHTRAAWYLYEGLTGTQLPIENLRIGNYVPLLDPKRFFTASPQKISRQRIDDNLLGTLEFSPMVRRGTIDFPALNKSLKEECRETVAAFPASIYQRAIRYLYAKESKSSHEIERETPSTERAQRFVTLLEQAWERDFLTKEALVEIQNTIVDPRFRNEGYRELIGEQIYVGEQIVPGSERIHYIGPKPEDTPLLMGHFLEVSRKLIGDPLVPDLVAAALISYLFNFIHPFSDGNGRIHRFLMHHALARRDFGPQGVTLPISAVILSRPQDYDRSLESFSGKLLRLIDYELDERLRMTVLGDTLDHYRYIDATTLVEVFHEFAAETIRTELPSEISYLQRYDQCRAQMRTIVDFPNRHAELLLNLCLQNGGRLSLRKRQLPEFAQLSDQELEDLESVIQESFSETLAG